MQTELENLQQLLQDVQEGRHPYSHTHPPNCKEHLIRAIQNRIADIHLRNHCSLRPAPETLREKLQALPFKTLDRYIECFNESKLTVPRVLWEVWDETKQKESNDLLLMLIEDEQRSKPTTNDIY